MGAAGSGVEKFTSDLATTKFYPEKLHKPKKRGPGRSRLTKRPKRKYQPPSQDNWTPITEAVHSQEIYNPPTSEHFLPTPKYPSSPQFSQTPQQFFPVKEQFSSDNYDSPPLTFSPDSVGLINQGPQPPPSETYPLRPKRNNFGGPPHGQKRKGQFQTTQLGKSSYISVWVPS